MIVGADLHAMDETFPGVAPMCPKECDAPTALAIRGNHIGYMCDQRTYI
jgi:hypothetical protein